MRYLIGVLVAAVAWGQGGGTAGVSGRVLLDVLHEPIQTTVKIGESEIQTDSGGQFRIDTLRAGKQNVVIAERGFVALRLKADLRAGENLDLGIILLRVASNCSGSLWAPNHAVRPLGDGVRTGVIRGDLHTDAKGAPLADATVVLRDETHEVGRTKTDQLGKFTFLDVSPGPYSLRFEKQGFWNETAHFKVVAGLELIYEGDWVLESCGLQCGKPRPLRICE